MIRIEYRNSLGEKILEYRLGDRVFMLDEINKDIEDYDRILINSGIKNIYYHVSDSGVFRDYIVELEKSEEEMWMKVGDTTRNEVNRFQRENNYSYHIIESASMKQIVDFCDDFSDALRAKGHHWHLTEDRFRNLYQGGIMQFLIYVMRRE